jgi:hypothetical protein
VFSALFRLQSQSVGYFGPARPCPAHPNLEVKALPESHSARNVKAAAVRSTGVMCVWTDGGSLRGRLVVGCNWAAESWELMTNELCTLDGSLYSVLQRHLTDYIYIYISIYRVLQKTSPITNIYIYIYIYIYIRI